MKTEQEIIDLKSELKMLKRMVYFMCPLKLEDRMRILYYLVDWAKDPNTQAPKIVPQDTL